MPESDWSRDNPKERPPVRRKTQAIERQPEQSEAYQESIVQSEPRFAANLPWLLSLVALAISAAAGSLLIVPYSVAFGLPLAACAIVLACGAIATRRGGTLALTALAIGSLAAIIFFGQAIKLRMDGYYPGQGLPNSFKIP